MMSPGYVHKRGALILLAALTFSYTTAPCDIAHAAGGWHAYNPTPAPAPRRPEAEVRAGGVLEESYNYHQQGPENGVAGPLSPWYGWGFPVQTYRWGWFGAQHYYPYTYWHQDYYDNCCRFSYRSGY
jgi:hypothetical protein